MSTTSPELQNKILEDFLHYFLPDGLLDFFDPVMAEDKEHQIKKDEVYKRELLLYFDERDNRTPEMQNLRPNGFTEERIISNFPGRNRKLTLHIRRRRWLDEDVNSVILNVYERYPMPFSHAVLTANPFHREVLNIHKPYNHLRQ